MSEEAPSEFHVRYRFELGDLKAAHKFLRVGPWRGVLIRLVVLVAFYLLIAFIGSNFDPQRLARSLARLDDWEEDWGSLILLGTLGALFVFFPLRWSIPQVAFLKLPVANKEIHMTFEGKGYRVADSGGEYFRPWTAVRRVVESQTHYFLVTKEDTYLVAPRRAFAGDDDYRASLEFVRVRVAESADVTQQPTISSS